MHWFLWAMQQAFAIFVPTACGRDKYKFCWGWKLLLYMMTICVLFYGSVPSMACILNHLHVNTRLGNAILKQCLKASQPKAKTMEEC